MNLRSGRRSTSVRAGHGLGEGQGESGRANEHGNGESHEAPLLAPLPPPPPPPMTPVEIMAELLAACWESAAAHQETARAMDIMAQAIVGLARGGHGGNGGNGGGARHPKGPSSYQDFLKTHPPTFTPSDEPLDVEHWLHIMEQKFLLLDVADEQKVRFAAQQLLGSASAWWDTFHAME